MSTNTSSTASLRPTWQNRNTTQGGSGGRGFQPPPQVASERVTTTSSTNSNSKGPGTNGTNEYKSKVQGNASSSNKTTNNANSSTYKNKYAALDDDEDDDAIVATAASGSTSSGELGHSNNNKSYNNNNSSSRSEALRSGGAGANAGPRPTAAPVPSKVPTRTLADLVAGTAGPTIGTSSNAGGNGSTPSASTTDRDRGYSGAGGTRFTTLRGRSNSGNHNLINSFNAPNSSTSVSVDRDVNTAKVVPPSASASTVSGHSDNPSNVNPSFENVAPQPVAVPMSKVTRFTRERLLSMRPKPMDKPLPSLLEQIEGSVILSDIAQDPVCWDTFDAEEIWATSTPQQQQNRIGGSGSGAGGRATGSVGMKGGANVSTSTGVPSEDASNVATSRRSGGLSGRSNSIGGTDIVGGRTNREMGGTSALFHSDPTTARGVWQRGVALPPPEQGGKKGRDRESDDPAELWDDPGSAEGAAMDFSAFGGIPLDDSNEGGADAFDLDKMSEAAKKFEEELHGTSRSRASSGAADSDDILMNTIEDANIIKVDPKRPLASDGTTIRSGSGDHVNVFEDFDAPNVPVSLPTSEIVSEASDDILKTNPDEDTDASSRLMALIGVTKSDTINSKASNFLGSTDGSIGLPNGAQQPSMETNITSPWGIQDSILLPKSSSDGTGIGIPLNPWSDPVSTRINHEQQSLGPDLHARLREAEMEQKNRTEELLRHRQQEQQQLLLQQEEAQRRALAKQAEQDRARQLQQQQQAGVQSQVESVLMERITTFLENSWGRSDLVSILTTLHAEDTRVISLLSNLDSLRALLLRNPQRIALRQDQALGAEMASLLMTNAQYQQQQQAVAAAAAQQQQAQRLRAQQEEIQRREQKRRLEEQEAAARNQNQHQAIPLVPDAPWFYSDPQNNIQGPFGGEEMRQWLEAGYFKGDLPVSQQSMGPFRPLSAIFPDLSVAFRFQSKNPSSDEAAAVAARAESIALEERARALEAERLAQQEHQQAAERERQEQERQAKELAAERERKAREAYAERQRLLAERQRQVGDVSQSDTKSATTVGNVGGMNENGGNGGNESSTQLKMLLGLNAPISGSESTKQKAVPSGASQSLTPQTTIVQNAQSAGKANDKKNSKVANKNNQLKQTEQPVVDTVVVNTVAAPAPAAAPAWGGAAVAKPATKKSMSEIQKEEARAAAMAAATQGSAPASGGWANVAASRGTNTAWSGMAAQQKPSVLTKPASAASAVARGPTTRLAPSSVTPASNKPLSSAQVQQQHAQAAQSSGANEISASQPPNSSTDAFGAKLSPQLEKWCKEQMQKLNGTDDLTLVSFCMTLNDPVEIRQYITTYLGATQPVNNFATEFINRSGKANPKDKNSEPEWESTAKNKGRKKKPAAGANAATGVPSKR